MMKKIVSLLLALAICFSLVPCAFAAKTSAADKFTDVPADAWYLNELDYALANGYISGTSATTFSPSADITRGQFVTILGRMLNAPTSGRSTRFTDVDATSWYAPYVAWAAQNGYVNGTSNATFSPDALITVEQMGVIISNYISKSGVELSGYTSSAAYKDASSISSWAVSSMDLMRQYGLLVTDVAGNVNPHKSVNRAEGTVSLVRLAKSTGLGAEPVIEQKPVAASGDILSRFIVDDPQLVTKFEEDDASAWESNIRYMIKHGLRDVILDVKLDGQIWDKLDDAYMAGDMYAIPELIDDYFDNDIFSKVAAKYHPLGLNFGTEELYDEVHLTCQGVLDETVSAFLEKAVRVHDELWADGTLISTMTQKEKARVYYDWLIKHCAYDLEEAQAFGPGPSEAFAFPAHKAYGALIDGKAVCDGYAKAYNLFLMLEGIDCGTESTPDHMWSTATLDGVLYHIDPTWGDTESNPDKYFCMTPEASWARFK